MKVRNVHNIYYIQFKTNPLLLWLIHQHTAYNVCYINEPRRWRRRRRSTKYRMNVTRITISTTLVYGAGAVDRYDVEVLVSFSFSFFMLQQMHGLYCSALVFFLFFRFLALNSFFFFFGLACRRDGCCDDDSIFFSCV